MLDAEGGGVGSRGGTDLERGVGALQRFQKRVTALLTEFENGPGGSTKVAQHTIARGAFSGANLPFAEADGLFHQYNRVHKELVSLSKLLSDQIEMLRIGVHAAEVGLDNVDEEARRRFHSIKARVDEAHYRQQEQERAKEQDRNDSTTGTKDLG
ncbi:hypothetical protein ACFPM3_14320 [Streptomyces coeruleoprunus]|uniref:Uncharacterized protein n=1 Tax=Streptomyces coeruleoprunus TaxID=285563 RepID=A0ABV9XDD7_9ACTN